MNGNGENPSPPGHRRTVTRNQISYQWVVHIQKAIGVSLRTIERQIRKLKEEGEIEFRGSPKTGGYYAKKMAKNNSKRMGKKSQAAMEFMLTYGWAITVVVVAIASLAYFGVLDLGNFAPSMCTLPTGLSCLDHSVTVYAGNTRNRIELNLKNNLGSQITITEIKIPQFNDKTASQNIILNNGDKTQSPNNIIVNNLNNGLAVIPSGERYEIEFTISYSNTPSGLTHIGTGSATGKVD